MTDVIPEPAPVVLAEAAGIDDKSTDAQIVTAIKDTAGAYDAAAKAWELARAEMATAIEAEAAALVLVEAAKLARDATTAKVYEVKK